MRAREKPSRTRGLPVLQLGHNLGELVGRGYLGVPLEVALEPLNALALHRSSDHAGGPIAGRPCVSQGIDAEVHVMTVACHHVAAERLPPLGEMRHGLVRRLLTAPLATAVGVYHGAEVAQAVFGSEVGRLPPLALLTLAVAHHNEHAVVLTGEAARERHA